MNEETQGELEGLGITIAESANHISEVWQVEESNNTWDIPDATSDQNGDCTLGSTINK